MTFFFLCIAVYIYYYTLAKVRYHRYIDRFFSLRLCTNPNSQILRYCKNYPEEMGLKKKEKQKKMVDASQAQLVFYSEKKKPWERRLCGRVCTSYELEWKLYIVSVVDFAASQPVWLWLLWEMLATPLITIRFYLLITSCCLTHAEFCKAALDFLGPYRTWLLFSSFLPLLALSLVYYQGLLLIVSNVRCVLTNWLNCIWLNFSHLTTVVICT